MTRARVNLAELAMAAAHAVFGLVARILWHTGLTRLLLRRLAALPAVIVLTYHRVEPNHCGAAIGHPPNVIDREIFRAHLAWLASWCRPVSAGMLQDILEGRDEGGVGYLVTFDDGYRDVLEIALPIVEERKARAAVLISSGVLEGKMVLPADAAAGVTVDHAASLYLDVRGARELKSRGATVGAHSVSHRPLEELSRSEQEDEIMRSKAMLEEALGMPVDVFSWPIGRVPDGLRDVARRAGFALAFGNRFGAVRPGDEPLDLPRVAAVDYPVPSLAAKALVALLVARFRRRGNA